MDWLSEAGFGEKYWVPCFRGAVDSWSHLTFHTKCDYKGPTLTLARKDSYLFGGFADESWIGKLLLHFVSCLVFQLLILIATKYSQCVCLFVKQSINPFLARERGREHKPLKLMCDLRCAIENCDFSFNLGKGQYWIVHCSDWYINLV